MGSIKITEYMDTMNKHRSLRVNTNHWFSLDVLGIVVAQKKL
jgi:hypothetical protein